MSKKLVNSVKKALDVLDILVFEDINRQGMQLAELSRRTGIPSNTLHAIAATLAACEYVEQNQTSSYLAGSKIEAIGRMNFVRKDLARHLPEILNKYREETGESLVFYTLVNAEKIALNTVNRKGIFGINLDELRKTPFFSNATGRIMYTYASESEKISLNERWGEFPQDSCQEKILEDGYLEYLSHQGAIYNLSLPILFENGKLFGAIGLYAPTKEINDKNKRHFCLSMKKMKQELEKLLK